MTALERSWTMENSVLDKLYEYAVGIRRTLHQYPELGFELENTVKLVSRELSSLGIEYTYKYGKGSVACELGKGKRLIALRADMDALPIEEKTGLPYSSRIKGKMHACGHDAHTAVLLAVARYLKENEERLKCRVRLIFQPSEECAESGAKMMVENGVCEGVSEILAAHCENVLDAGAIGIRRGDYMAACIPATVRFIGRSAHAALPEFGVDAIGMANEAYLKMKEAVREESRGERYIWSVGSFHGGTAHNIIAELCEMDISFRFYDLNFAERVEKRVREICSEVAKKFGGRAEILWNLSSMAVRNDEALTDRFAEVARDAGLETVEMPQKMSSEDFGWYLEQVPGVLFRFGTRNEALGCAAVAHRGDFCIDESGMRSAIKAFCAYITGCEGE